MKLQHVAPLALATVAAAQNNTAPGLLDVLNNRTLDGSLSDFVGLLQGQPALVSMLANMTNITILVPNNSALEELDLNQDDPSISPLVMYHVLNGTYYASNFTNNATFIPTLLTNQTYTNVTGGQVVEAMMMDGNVTITTGLGTVSNVVAANYNFTGGVIHVIDHTLEIPSNVTDTAIQANLTALAGAVTQADLGTTLDELQDVTIFAPDNDAFREIGSITGNLSTSALRGILEYHVIQGTVAYSSTLENSTLETVAGSRVNITVYNGTVYVNEARVVIPDVLVANGVVHVVDGVLNPNNTESSNPTNTEPAFPGASSASEIPFTSGVPSATHTGTGLQTPESTSMSTSTSEEAAVPMATGAMLMGALFGGAAVLVNGL